jgi:hypothetical protein
VLKKIINAIHQTGLNEYDPTRYERLVADCDIQLGSDLTITERPPDPNQTPPRDDGRGVANVAQQVTGVHNATPNSTSHAVQEKRTQRQSAVTTKARSL